MPHNKKQMDRIHLLRAKKERYLLNELIAMCDPNAKMPADMKALLADEFVELKENGVKVRDESRVFLENFDHCND